MDIRTQFASLYGLLKLLFEQGALLSNSVLIGSIREHIAGHFLAFFPEETTSGWIYDHAHKHTGHIDLMLSLGKALRIPALLFHDAAVSGRFARQVISAFEVKSRIDNNIEEVIRKTWQCHRLSGGFQKSTSERLDGKEYRFDLIDGVPLCVVGSNGFACASTYENHFNRFAEISYTVDGEMVPGPNSAVDVIPDITLDFSRDAVLVPSRLLPVVVERKLSLEPGVVNRGAFSTLFGPLPHGVPLAILLYYLEMFRSDLDVAQLTGCSGILETFSA